jgi:hypothetical protein
MTLSLSPLIDDPEDDPFEIDPDGIPRPIREVKPPTNSIHIQGNLIEIRGDTSNFKPPPPGERKPITEFSRKSRFHLLRRIARIAWSEIPASYFITLTYPDEVAIVPSPVATMQRSHFVRYAEKYLSEEIPMLWAKELQTRKSGVYTGQKLAHWHLSVFTDKEIPCHKISEWWKKSIGWKRDVQTHRKKLPSSEHAAFYLAKYTSKRPTQGILEYPPKLTNPGRSWGFLRDGQIPKCPITRIDGCAQELFDVVQAAAAASWDDPMGEISECYTFIGPVAQRLAKEIFEILY